MGAPQFTPGPWEFGERYGMLKTEVIAADHSRAIATVWTHKQPTVSDPREVAPDEAGTANARLIAAAPELYEALEALVERTIEYVGEEPFHPDLECDDEMRALAKNGRAALSKARGEVA